jgi:hypothetical protein
VGQVRAARLVAAGVDPEVAGRRNYRTKDTVIVQEVPLDRLMAEPFARDRLPSLARMETLEQTERVTAKPSALYT